MYKIALHIKILYSSTENHMCVCRMDIPYIRLGHASSTLEKSRSSSRSGVTTLGTVVVLVVVAPVTVRHDALDFHRR